MARTPAPLRLRVSGRYGPFWWVAIEGSSERVVLATHLRLIHDPRRSQQAKLDLLVLSGAS